MFDLEDVSASIGDRTLLDDVTWRVGPGDRFGLVGINGSGKTSLLRVLAGDKPIDGGKRVQGQTVRLAHLTQELHDLPGNLRVLEAIEQVAGRVTLGKVELTASQLAERFGFGSTRQWTPVSDLSGGERRRLQLARLLMDEPNVLLLDEPTNDLDIDTLQQLEDLLDSWPGTMVVVSHDRYLIERVCDNVVALFGDGKITQLVGGIDEYLARLDQLTAAASTPITAPRTERAATRWSERGRTPYRAKGPGPHRAPHRHAGHPRSQAQRRNGRRRRGHRPPDQTRRRTPHHPRGKGRTRNASGWRPPRSSASPPAVERGDRVVSPQP